MSGLSCAFQTSNSPELGPGKWNADEDRSYLLQMDISSMYPYIMTMPTPVSSGEKLSLPEGRAERLAWVKRKLGEIDFKPSDEALWTSAFPATCTSTLTGRPPAR